MYGHVEKLAEEIKKGASSVEGVEAKLWQVMMCVILFMGHILFQNVYHQVCYFVNCIVCGCLLTEKGL